MQQFFMDEIHCSLFDTYCSIAVTRKMEECDIPEKEKAMTEEQLEVENNHSTQIIGLKALWGRDKSSCPALEKHLAQWGSWAPE